MSNDPAKARYIVINAVRLTGVALVILGILITQGWFDLPDIAAYVLIAVGLVEVFVMPLFLARRWRTPPE